MMPIMIRYGPTGLLAAAAAQAGEGMQNQADLSLVMRDRMQRQQAGDLQDQEMAEQNMQANKLQLAAQLQQQRQQGSPTSRNQGNVGGSPFAQAIMSKKMIRQAVLGDQPLADSDAATLDQAERNPQTDLPMYETLARSIQTRQVAQQKTAQAQADQTAIQSRFDTTQKTEKDRAAQVETDKAATAQATQQYREHQEQQAQVRADALDQRQQQRMQQQQQAAAMRAQLQTTGTALSASRAALQKANPQLAAVADAPVNLHTWLTQNSVSTLPEDLDALQNYKQAQTAHQQVIQQMGVAQSGTLPNGIRVHQLPDGSVVDEQGNPVQ